MCFVATKVCLSRQTYFCPDKTFVATKLCLFRQNFCPQQTYFCRDKNDTCGSSRQWYPSTSSAGCVNRDFMWQAHSGHDWQANWCQSIHCVKDNHSCDRSNFPPVPTEDQNAFRNWDGVPEISTISSGIPFPGPCPWFDYVPGVWRHFVANHLWIIFRMQLYLTSFAWHPNSRERSNTEKERMQLETGLALIGNSREHTRNFLTLKSQAQSWSVHTNYAVDWDCNFIVSIYPIRRYLTKAWSVHKSPYDECLFGGNSVIVPLAWNQWLSERLVTWWQWLQ